MEQPPDGREYRRIRLTNGLEALLVRDAKAGKVGAAMSVGVGNLCDPDDLPGLAHLCEHLLFLGTEKYPNEREFNEYLSHHAGESNAVTTMDETIFYFSVDRDHLYGAVDRFSQFFTAPLFDESCMEREVQAVENEFKAKLRDDANRMYQLMRSLSNPDHPVHRFGSGNLETIWTTPRKNGVNVRSELLRFHERYYSANLMKFAVLGSEPLDQLADMVVSKLSAIPNKHIPRPSFGPDPIRPSELGTIVHFKPIDDLLILRLIISVPYLKPYWRSQPGLFLTHFLGHEGPGSILAYLRRRDWCLDANASIFGGSVGFDFLHLTFSLTPQGLVHWGEIVAAVFDYADLMRDLVEQNDGSFPQWMFDEQKRLGELNFDFSFTPLGATYTAMQRARLLHDNVSPEYTLTDLKYREMNAPAIRTILDYVRPSRARVYLAAQSLPPEMAHGRNPLPMPTEREKYFGTEYSLTPFPSWIFDPSRPRTPGLALPGPNRFIPHDLRLSPPQTRFVDTSAPVLLSHSDRLRLWYQPDLQAKEPKVNVWLLFKYAPPTVTAHDKAVVRIFLAAMQSVISEYLYDARLAGLQFLPLPGSGWAEMFVMGYRDKLGDILRFLLEHIKTFVPDQDLLAHTCDRFRQAWTQWELKSPFSILNDYLRWFSHDDTWLGPDLVGSLDQLQTSDLVRFRDAMLSRASVELYINGNCGEADALAMRDMVGQDLPVLDPATEEPPPRTHSLLLDPGTDTLLRFPLRDPNEVNSAVLWYVQMGDASRANLGVHAALELLVDLVREPAFDELRTNQQLGYHTTVNTCVHANSFGFSIQLQSVFVPRAVRKRIEYFLRDQIAPLLRDMTPEAFAARRSALAGQMLSTTATTPYLQIQAARDTIMDNLFDFQHAQRLAYAVQHTSLTDLQALFTTYVHPDSPHRSKLIIELESARPRPLRTRRSRRARDSRAPSLSQPMDWAGPEAGGQEQVPHTTAHSLAEARALRDRLRRSEPAQPVRPWTEYAPPPG